MSVSSRHYLSAGVHARTYLDPRILLPLLATLVVLFHKSLSCSVVQPCTNMPPIGKLSYEMGTSNPRMFCSRSGPNIEYWEFTVCDGDSRPVCTPLPGQYCLFPDSPVLINDVCTSNNGGKLVFENIKELSNSSGTLYANFTSESFNHTLQIQYSPTGVFVLEPTKQLAPDATIALLTWYAYTPDQQINYTITHNGKVIADQSSHIVVGYGSVNLDSTICVGVATGGEVTKEYILLINNITANIGGHYVFKMNGIYEAEIILEVPESNDTTSVVPMVPSSVTVESSSSVPLSSPSIPFPASSTVVPMSISLTTHSSSPVTSTSSSIVTTSSSVMTKAESALPTTTLDSPTLSPGSDSDTAILIAILVLLGVVIIAVLLGVVVCILIWRHRKKNAIGESEADNTFRTRRISAFKRANSTVDGDTPMTPASAPDPDTITCDPSTITHVLETSLQKEDNKLSSVSSNGSTGSKRPLLLDEFRGGRTGDSGSIVSSLSGSEAEPTTSRVNVSSKSSLDEIVSGLSVISSKIDETNQKLDRIAETGAENLEVSRDTQGMIGNALVMSVEAEVNDNEERSINGDEIESQSSCDTSDTPPIVQEAEDVPVQLDNIDDNDLVVDAGEQENGNSGLDSSSLRAGDHTPNTNLEDNGDEDM